MSIEDGVEGDFGSSFGAVEAELFGAGRFDGDGGGAVSVVDGQGG